MATLEDLRSACPTFGIVLGSGLGSVAEALGAHTAVPYSSIPGLAAVGVAGHKGSLSLAKLGSTRLLLAQGRSHLYEGHSAATATQMIAIMHQLGVRQVLLTNAAGSICADFRVGGLMLLTDHLNLTGTTPLLGGPHFVDMTEVYSSALRQRMKEAAQKLSIPLHEGVYAGLLGPQYETPAEVRMLRTLGADAVGMSTVLEAIRARSLSMEVLGLSTLTNLAAGLSSDLLNHEEVISTGKSAAARIEQLLREFFNTAPHLSGAQH